MDNSITRLLNEANEKNSPKRPLTLINITPQVPQVLEGNEKHNTQVTIEGVLGRVYTGSQTLLYKRISLTDALAGLQLRNIVPFTTQMVIDMVNTQLGLFITIDDLEPFTPPTLALNETASLTLIPKAESFGFVGQVQIQLMYGRTLLESVIGIRLLKLFNHPNDPAFNKQSGRMATWGIDFTSLRDSLKINPLTLSYTDWATFQSACIYLQIPSWAKGQLIDSATADVPDSNPAFDRVTIQPVVNSAYIFGPLYFHYNLLDEV
jgi:hypothetical protein